MNKCFFCHNFHKLPDKYWCLEHEREITGHGICEHYKVGVSIKEIIAETDEHRKWRESQ